MIELLLDVVLSVVGIFVEIPVALVALACVFAMAVIFSSTAGWVTFAILCVLLAWRRHSLAALPRDPPDRELR